MLLNSRAAAIIGLLLVLVISLVLLGVSGSIVHNYQQYGSVFFRERQLSIFNVALSIAGILISLFGFLAVLARRIACSKITIFACLLLALCAFSSLITAVAVNFLDVDYVHARFLDNMKNYKTDADARRSVDLVQRKYGCCGGSMWLDWATVPLITNTPDTQYITTTQPTGTTTTTPNPYNILNFWQNLGLLDIASIVNGAAQPQSKTTTTESPAVESDAYIGRETTSTTTKQPGRLSPQSTSTAGYEDDDSFNFFAIQPSKEHRRKKRDASTHSSTTTTSSAPATGSSDADQDSTTAATTTTTTEKPRRPHHEPKDSHEEPKVLYQNVAYGAPPKHLRHERQAVSNYGNLYGLPISYTVPLPQSCCTLDTPSIFNSLDAYCISNANNVENTFHRSGCADRITKVAMGQALSIAVLNGFLIVVALLTIALLQRTHVVVVTSSKTYRASSMNDMQGPYGANQKATLEKVNKTSVINPNPDQSIYQ